MIIRVVGRATDKKKGKDKGVCKRDPKIKEREIR